MYKKILRFALVAGGIFLIFIALFSDLLRGRPFLLGSAQIAVLFVGVSLLILNSILHKKNYLFKGLYMKVSNKMQTIRKSFSTSLRQMNMAIESLTGQFITYVQKRSIYPTTIWKDLNFVVFTVIFFLLLKYGFLQITNPNTDPWITGDWLINYQGGFVRRGLPGEILLWLSHALGIQVTLLVVITQMTVYLVFFINTYRLVTSSSPSALNLALIYSPAFMLFSIFDPYGGFRKEILFLALLSWICTHLIIKNGKRLTALPLIIGIIAIAIVLSHEMLTAFLPYLICAFLIDEGGLSKRIWLMISALIPAFLVGALVILFGRGDAQIVGDICASLLRFAPKNCLEGGAIGALSDNINMAHQVVKYYNDQETIIVNSLSLFLGFIPLFIQYYSTPLRTFFSGNRIQFWLLAVLISTMILSLPLLWVVADYGRLIHIHIVSLSLLVLMMNSKVLTKSRATNLWWLIGWIISLLYILGWRLIHHDASFHSVFPFIKIINRLFS